MILAHEKNEKMRDMIDEWTGGSDEGMIMMGMKSEE